MKASRPRFAARRALRVAAALLLILAWTSGSSPEVSAQFGLFVNVTSPAPGTTVGGTIAVTASASPTIQRVQFTLDGVNLGAEDTAEPFSVSWNTRTATNGSHTLRAVGRDVLGAQWTSDPVTVTVFNDTTPPTVAISAPAAGAMLAAVVTVNATAADNVGVVGVQFRLDGAALGVEDTAAPYSVQWDTRTATAGAHVLTAVARDAAGNTATSTSVAVTVDNTAPAVNISAPAAGATVSSTITVTASASDNVAVAAVQFRLGGTPLGAEDTIAPFEATWDTRTATNGLHSLTAVARDSAGNITTSAAVEVSVNNTTGDTTPPVVSMTAPAAGATVAGTVTVNADASDNIGVAGVRFRLDGVDLGAEDTAAPYSIAWDSRTAANGSHVLTAVARDAAGNTTTSTAVSVTVDNIAPTVSVTAPAAGTTVAGTVTVTAAASDNVSVVGVQFRLDGVNLGTEDTAAPYSVPWDTTTATNGSHTLTAVARDAAGNSTTAAAVTVTVSNTAANTLRIDEGNTAIEYQGSWNQGNTSRPWSGGTAAIGFAVGQNATLSFRGTGVTWIGFRANWAGIANVYLDGTLAATVDAYSATEVVGATMFTASGLASGPHTLRIEVTRTKNAASSDYVVVVDAFDIINPAPDSGAPTISITSPTGGATVFGTVPINATASDDTGVASVAFFVDGTQVGATDTVSPYSVSWDTRTVSDGSHTLTAIARDAAGNSTASAPVSVIVSNTAPPPVSSATRIENTSVSIIYTDGCLSCGQPPEWFHGSRSRDWSGGTSSFNRAEGARATFSFTGTAITLISFRAAWAGIARVYVDGAFVQELDLYSPTEQAKAPVFQMTGLTPAVTHTIAVESTGRKNVDANDYAVVVDAFDVSPPYPPPAEGTRSEEIASSVTLTAGWTRGDASQPWSGGTAAVSSTAGERATFVFTGTAVRWIGRRAPSMGIARVYLDGAFHAEADMFAPTAQQETVLTIVGLEPAQHRLEIEVTGAKHTNSTGTAIVVDAFDVRSRFEDNDAALTYSGTWGFNYTNRNWSGTSLSMGSGTMARSATAGARADFTFTGTSVSWIGIKAPWGGIADVYLDGILAARVDLYDPTEQLQLPVFTASNLTPTTHTLRIEATGLKNDASSTALVIVDAFDVTIPTPAPPVTRLQETDSRITYTGTWSAGGR
jgi:hypothetical protein